MLNFLSYFKNKETKQEGFAILYAVLVAGVVAIGGILLSTIIFKQLILTGVGQNSQVSYYAADVGRACAKYWREYGYFGHLNVTESGTTFQYDQTPIYCVNNTPIDPIPVNDGSIDPTVGVILNFKIKDINNNSCAAVLVENNTERFKIVSTGYNNSSCASGNSRLVLRQVQEVGTYAQSGSGN